MAVSNTVVKTSYQGNGTNTTFALAFKVIEGDSVETKVYIRDVTDPGNPTETLKVEGALQDYTLTGASPPTTPFHTDVEFNTAPTATQIVVVIRQLTLTHDLDLTANSQINKESLEDKIDRCVALVQQLAEVQGRAPRLPITEQFAGDLEIPHIYAGKVIGFNAAGTAIQMYTASDLLALSTGGFGSTFIKAIADSETNEVVPSMTADSSLHKSAIIHFSIERSTNVFASGFVFLQELNGTWRVKESLFSGEEHGLTWGVSESAGVAQLLYTSDTLGAGYLYTSIMKLEI